MSIRRRLERLERERVRPCPECGIRPGEVPPVEVEVVSAPVADPSPKHCSVCGEWLIVYWPEVLNARAPDYPPASETGGRGIPNEQVLRDYAGRHGL